MKRKHPSFDSAHRCQVAASRALACRLLLPSLEYSSQIRAQQRVTFHLLLICGGGFGGALGCCCSCRRSRCYLRGGWHAQPKLFGTEALLLRYDCSGAAPTIDCTC